MGLTIVDEVFFYAFNSISNTTMVVCGLIGGGGAQIDLRKTYDIVPPKCPRSGNNLAGTQRAPSSRSLQHPIPADHRRRPVYRLVYIPSAGRPRRPTTATLQQFQYENNQFRELSTFKVHVIKNAL